MATQLVQQSVSLGLSVGKRWLALAKRSKHVPDVVLWALERAEEICVSFLESKAGRAALQLAARAITAADKKITEADAFLLKHQFTAALRDFVVSAYLQCLVLISQLLELLGASAQAFVSESEGRKEDSKGKPSIESLTSTSSAAQGATARVPRLALQELPTANGQEDSAKGALKMQRGAEGAAAEEQRKQGKTEGAHIAQERAAEEALLKRKASEAEAAAEEQRRTDAEQLKAAQCAAAEAEAAAARKEKEEKAAVSARKTRQEAKSLYSPKDVQKEGAETAEKFSARSQNPSPRSDAGNSAAGASSSAPLPGAAPAETTKKKKKKASKT